MCKRKVCADEEVIVVNVAACFANGWENFGGYPVFEAFGGFKFAAEGKRVDSGFVDKPSSTLT